MAVLPWWFLQWLFRQRRYDRLGQQCRATSYASSNPRGYIEISHRSVVSNLDFYTVHAQTPRQEWLLRFVPPALTAECGVSPHLRHVSQRTRGRTCVAKASMCANTASRLLL